MSQQTHRLVNKPKISGRHIADYMAASETSKRTIVRNCKYQPIGRIVQHDHAKAAISKFICDGYSDTASLVGVSEALRERLADSDFDRDVLDFNADYIERFAKVHSHIAMPKADILPPGSSPAIMLNGTRVTAEIHFRVQRLTKTNKVRVGAGMLRYAKGKRLPPAVGEWQSAFLMGYLNRIGVESGAEPEHKLCLTLDAHTGVAHEAPTDAVRRFQYIEAACATIAERWANVAPPAGAVF